MTFGQKLLGLPAALLRWLNGPGIARKLILINLLPFAVVIALSLVVVPAVNVLSGLRAYVAGEGFYSKYQKDAVFYLQRYLEDGDEADYLRFFRDIGVPTGDGLARQELEKVPPDRDRAAIDFLQGRNDPSDVPSLVDLFLRYRHVPFVERAVEVWSDADLLVNQLEDVGADAHQQIATGRMTPRDQRLALARIGELNDQLIGLENDFSRTLGEGFTITSHVLFFAMASIAALVLVLGFLLSRTLGHSIETEIASLSHTVNRIAAGDLTVRFEVDSSDEFGDLARGFNAMASHVEHSYQELQQARDAALRSSRIKSSFLADMSREICSPLYLMLGYADALETQLGNNPALAAQVGALRNAGDLLVASIRSVLDFSKIEAGDFPLNAAPIDLGALFARELRELEVLSTQRRTSIQYRSEEHARTTIMFDENCLRGALTNLLIHAINLTEGGVVSARCFRADSGELRIEVRADRPGTDPALLPVTGRPFAPDPEDHREEFENGPFRLALARNYLRVSGAKLSVAEVPGASSMFTVVFPAGCELAPALREIPRPVLTLVPKSGDGASPPLVLVVDGDADSRLMLKGFLDGRYKVLEAASGDEAFRALQDLEDTVSVIVDGLPPFGRDNGISLARGLHKDTRYGDIPIVALLPDGTPQDRRRAFAEECNAFLSRPVNQVQLFATLERLRQA